MRDFEYQVASHLIYEGFLEEGLAIVKGVRDRHTGERRNPWNEFECGNHYARSLASYGLLTALSGFYYSAPKQWIQFQPKIHPEAFQCFFSVGSGWGTYCQQVHSESCEIVLNVLYGELSLRRLSLDLPLTSGKVYLGQEPVDTTFTRHDKGVDLLFDKSVLIRPETPLKVFSEE